MPGCAQALSPSECLGECTGMGICQMQEQNANTRRCWCNYGREGDDCSKAVPGACMNDCSFKGKCIHGCGRLCLPLLSVSGALPVHGRPGPCPRVIIRTGSGWRSCMCGGTCIVVQSALVMRTGCMCRPSPALSAGISTPSASWLHVQVLQL